MTLNNIDYVRQYMSGMTLNYIDRFSLLNVRNDIKLKKLVKHLNTRRRDPQQAWGEACIKKQKSQDLHKVYELPL